MKQFQDRQVFGVCTLLICMYFIMTILKQGIEIDKSNRGNILIQDIKIFENLSKSYPHVCDCIRHDSIDLQVYQLPQSTCSDFSTQRGMNQKVVSYSYYNPDLKDQEGSKHYKTYFESIINRANEVKMRYPGWVMRVYHNVTREDVYGTEILCIAYCNNDHIDLCDVRNLPMFGQKLNQTNGEFWKFLPLRDPTVNIFISRNLDSVIQQRELDAVNEWLKSNATFHVMRDHPNHKSVILGGLWGTKNFQRGEELVKIRKNLLSWSRIQKHGQDKKAMKLLLWPFMKEDVLQHDSFNCHLKEHKNSMPFQTKRSFDTYLGWGPFTNESQLKIFMEAECPLQCRPSQHPDWTKC